MARSRKTPAPYETNPTDTLYRVYRGGCWYDNAPSWVRAASRGANVPAKRFNFLGFRCARGGSERKVKP